MTNRPSPSDRLRGLLGIRHPLLLAGMAGGSTTPELVAAVSEAGGLGVFGANGMTADDLAASVRRARELTDAPVGVNVLLAAPTTPDPRGLDPHRALAPLRRELGVPDDPPDPPPASSPDELVAAGLEAGARVVSVGLGDPAPVVPAARAAGAPVVAMVTTAEDAELVVASGADAVVAQGAEAGGHRSTVGAEAEADTPLVGTLALVPQVARAVDVPVIAAGGIMDGRGLVAALALGAAGVQMGTRFLVSEESGVPPAYRDRVRSARDTDTVITRAISGRPARGIRNRLMELMEAAGPPALGYPLQSLATRPLRAPAGRAGDPEALVLFAGQAAGLSGPARPAGEIVADVIAEAEEAIRTLAL